MYSIIYANLTMYMYTSLRILLCPIHQVPPSLYTYDKQSTYTTTHTTYNIVRKIPKLYYHHLCFNYQYVIGTASTTTV